jgi:hypothetical protein
MKIHAEEWAFIIRWFFNAFGPIIEPNVCILLDVSFPLRSANGEEL